MARAESPQDMRAGRFFIHCPLNPIQTVGHQRRALRTRGHHEKGSGHVKRQRFHVQAAVTEAVRDFVQAMFGAPRGFRGLKRLDDFPDLG